jgi:hypothetical protein
LGEDGVQSPDSGLSSRISEAETVSTWQSLAFGPNYKAAYCMAVCPAGGDVIGFYRQSIKDFTAEVVKPLQGKIETLYVIPGSDAEAHARRRYPHKTAAATCAIPCARAISQRCCKGCPCHFSAMRRVNLVATYHFTFTGSESATATVVHPRRHHFVQEGFHGEPNLSVTTDAATWLGFLAREKNLLWALLTRRVKLRGNPKWLLAFGRCFPG